MMSVITGTRLIVVLNAILLFPGWGMLAFSGLWRRWDGLQRWIVAVGLSILGYPVLFYGITTCSELLTVNQDHSFSLLHNWGKAPDWCLSTYVLGSRSTSGTTWQIASQSGDLHYVRREVPILIGTSVIYWTQQISETFVVDVIAPLGTRGSSLLSYVPADVQGWLNQQIVWVGGSLVDTSQVILEDVGLCIAHLSGGEYQIRAHFSEDVPQKAR
jgi:hypothetical protein